MRIAFMTPPTAGTTVTLGGRRYAILSCEPYTRSSDGEETRLFTWEGACADCDKPYTFKTGATAGDIVSRCRDCRKARWGAANGERDAKRREERELRKPADMMTIYRAVQAAQGDRPSVPMSDANNASRTRLYAPALLRQAYPPLEDHTHAEIQAGIKQAVARGLIMWDEVSRTKCGHARHGLVARSEVWLRRVGLWPVESAFD